MVQLELAYTTPTLTDPFTLDSQGVQINKALSEARFVFPSWRIVTAYSTVYHVHRALCDMCGVTYRATEHEAPLRAFKSTKLDPALDVLVGFPFNVRYGPNMRMKKGWTYKDFLPEQKGHLMYGYARHPRPPHYGFTNVLSRLTAEFRRSWAKGSQHKKHQYYMLPDLLAEFRNWVNYADIDSMVALRGEGFRSFLDQDLHTLIYFYCGIAELAALAAFGADWLLRAATERVSRNVCIEGGFPGSFGSTAPIRFAAIDL